MEVADILGLRPVGRIFTDLVSKDPKAGTVKHYRGTIDTYFLTAQECITSAYLQNKFPNICNLSPEGYFGSKFVTVVVTGDQNNIIHFEGYQVSNQCMALVKDDILMPTLDAPELGYIRESIDNRYVPDVFYKQKDKYGNSVTKFCRPLPVEYLLVHMSAAFPKEEQFSMTHHKHNNSRFPIENRESMDEMQTYESFNKYMRQFREYNYADALSNLHLLLYLYVVNNFQLKDQIKCLCKIFRPSIISKYQQMTISSNYHDNGKINNDQFVKFPEWQDTSLYSDNFMNAEIETVNDMCSCVHCTFENMISEEFSQMCGLTQKHGDAVYLKLDESKNKISSIELEEDDIDKLIAKMDGRIHRKRNKKYCRHGSSGKCIHCVPLEPYDEQYLEHCDPPIQFMSFHAYLRKLSGGQHQGKFTTLENINCKIKPGCKEHLPWPEGICTKCQPNAITLSIQKYRHVDNIMFENSFLMDDFLDYWRKTGCQRIGIMFGYYTKFDQAPLGIKAVVSAIYEPPQKSTRNSVELLNLDCNDNPNTNRYGSFLSDSVMEVADILGLRPVGWIFTDLVSKDPKAGTVKHYRGTIDTYFLTAQECITAAYLQNKFTNICSLSPEGYFGSKFVTVVVTGDQNNTIHFEGYQVSNQCMALVKDDILIPTHDAPELGYIRESTGNQYVPDVFCKQKDKYGNSVTKLGRPLPVEFLLVHMSAAFPKEEQFSMTHRRHNNSRFPIENRESMDEIQTYESFNKYMRQFSESNHADALSNLHLLWYLYAVNDFQLKDQIKCLCKIFRPSIISKYQQMTIGSSYDDNAKINIDQFVNFPEWQQFLKTAKIDSQGTSLFSGKTNPSNQCKGNFSSAKTKTETDIWSCLHCTFHNEISEASCQMCGLPQ